MSIEFPNDVHKLLDLKHISKEDDEVKKNHKKELKKTLLEAQMAYLKL